MTSPQIRKVGAALTTTHARSLLAEASRFAERLGVPLALIHATIGEAESQAHLREAANQLTIPVEKHIVWSKSESAQALLSAAEQADIELLVAGAFEGPALNRRRFLSSGARKMVDSARCSLLLLVQPRIDTHNFRRLVVLTDFSEVSKEACGQALWLAEKDAVECVHVISIHTTANRAQAAFEARQLYVALKANGWDETMRRRRGDFAEKKCDVTIGEYIEAVREKSLLRPAATESYAVALRMIAGAITGRESKAHRDAIKLRSITDDKVEAWRAAYIKRKATNPLAEKSARITASSLILRAKALFRADTLARVRDVVEVPDPVPFASVKAESVAPPRYRSTFDIIALVESAKEELATEHPELFKIFLLGAMAGLRRHEIDLLQWRAFLFSEGAIRIETTEHFRPKSASSEGDIHVDGELLDVFRGFRARAKSDSDFVIESSGDVTAAVAGSYDHYRCHHEFVALCKWLRSHGVISSKPLHTLRKEFGSQIHARYGLLAASEALRHGGVSVTARHYIENNQRSVLGFGHLLKSESHKINAAWGI